LRPDPQIVVPGQSVYFLSHSGAPPTEIARVEITSNPDFVELGDPAIAFTVSNLKIDKAAGTATGIVRNDSVSYAGVPAVYNVFFDEKGHPLAEDLTISGAVPSLAPGQSARLRDIASFSYNPGAATVKVFVSAHWFGPRP
jgi:hypothetical protein